MARKRSRSRRETENRSRRAAVRPYKSLDDELISAMTEIDSVYRATIIGLSVKTMNFNQIGSGGYSETVTKAERLRPYYLEWAYSARSIPFDIGAVLELIVHGSLLRDIDRNHNKRNGWAKRNLIKALNEWRRIRRT